MFCDVILGDASVFNPNYYLRNFFGTWFWVGVRRCCACCQEADGVLMYSTRTSTYSYEYVRVKKIPSYKDFLFSRAKDQKILLGCWYGWRKPLCSLPNSEICLHVIEVNRRAGRDCFQKTLSTRVKRSVGRKFETEVAGEGVWQLFIWMISFRREVLDGERLLGSASQDSLLGGGGYRHPAPPPFVPAFGLARITE